MSPIHISAAEEIFFTVVLRKKVLKFKKKGFRKVVGNYLSQDGLHWLKDLMLDVTQIKI